MTTDDQYAASNRPYTSPSSVITVLQRLRTRNLPERIDSEYLRDAGVPDSLNARTLFALRFLGLVENDVPASALRTIARSTDEEYQSILANLIREAYRDVFEIIDPAQDSQDRIVNFFRRYTPASQRHKMVIFFLGMCRAAGIPTLDAAKNRVPNGSTAAKSAGQKTASRPKPRSTKREAPPAPKVDNAQRMSNNLHPALELLVRSLPPVGSRLSTWRREQWLKMARETLAFVYPDQDDEGSVGQEEDIPPDQ